MCDGLDASGKTTTIKKAIETLREKGVDCEYVKGLKSYRLFGMISSIMPSTLTLSLELYAMDLFKTRNLLESGKTVIQDRWFDSVLSHNKELHRTKVIEYILQRTTKPDVYVLFDVSIEERIERLMQKEQKDDHSILLQNPEIIHERMERLRERFLNNPAQKYIIDTTGKTVEESGEELEKIIRKIK